VPTAVVVGNGPRLLLVQIPRGGTSGFLWDPDPERAAERRSASRPEDLPSALVERLRELPSDLRVVSVDPGLAPRLGSRMQRAVNTAALSEVRAARSELGSLSLTEERTFLRAVAAQALERALRSPEEVLVTLAREEERIERAVGREAGAIESFAQLPASALEGHRGTWEAAERALREHHGALLLDLETNARALMPNLSAVVGARIAARLLGASGTLSDLGRMSAPRLQLLGSRRRPSPDRGPRYGLIYRAERMADVPVGRRGAYARSLASLAAIAARADATTRRDLSLALVARRDRRVEELRRRRR
jgi:hypothetical protein